MQNSDREIQKFQKTGELKQYPLFLQRRIQLLQTKVLNPFNFLMKRKNLHMREKIRTKTSLIIVEKKTIYKGEEISTRSFFSSRNTKNHGTGIATLLQQWYSWTGVEQKAYSFAKVSKTGVHWYKCTPESDVLIWQTTRVHLRKTRWAEKTTNVHSETSKLAFPIHYTCLHSYQIHWSNPKQVCTLRKYTLVGQVGYADTWVYT